MSTVTPVCPPISPKTYTFTFLALMLLLALTYLTAHVDLGRFNLPAGLGIAAAKVALVMLYFMHLRHASGIHRIAACVGGFWLAILVVLTLTDYLSRGWLPLPGYWP